MTYTDITQKCAVSGMDFQSTSGMDFQSKERSRCRFMSPLVLSWLGRAAHAVTAHSWLGRAALAVTAHS